MRRIIFVVLSLLALNAFAETPKIVVAPQCLVNQLENPKIISTKNAYSLIEVDNAGIDKLIDLKTQNKKCGGFIDVTNAWKQFDKKNVDGFLVKYTQPHHPKLATRISYSIKYETQVNQLFNQMNPQNMWDNLTTLTSFKDRYANSDNGVKAANWIKKQIEDMAKLYHRNDVQVYTVATGNNYKQPSVVVKVGNANVAGVVVGAHMDTTAALFGKKPGADDDGSGTVTVLETIRTVLGSGMQFKKPIYFVWYSAEEEGLVGSGFVVEHFKKNNIPVDAVLHLDMTGYAHKNESTMWLIDDYVNSDLSTFLGKLIDSYVKKPVMHTACGYACSDHATWTQNGFVAAMPAESKFEDTNPALHTANDTVDKLSLVHMTDYLKLATAFTVEMAEPVN